MEQQLRGAQEEVTDDMAWGQYGAICDKTQTHATGADEPLVSHLMCLPVETAPQKSMHKSPPPPGQRPFTMASPQVKHLTKSILRIKN